MGVGTGKDEDGECCQTIVLTGNKSESTYRRDLEGGQQGEARAWTEAEGNPCYILYTLLCEPDGCP